jgi:hypothetical protein
VTNIGAIMRFLETMETNQKSNPLSLIFQRKNLELLLNAKLELNNKIFKKMMIIFTHSELMSTDRSDAIYRYVFHIAM